jgi:hypothetical protein
MRQVTTPVGEIIRNPENPKWQMLPWRPQRARSVTIRMSTDHQSQLTLPNMFFAPENQQDANRGEAPA